MTSKSNKGMNDLKTLLKEAGSLFKTHKRQKIDINSFSLDRVQRGFWCFRVIDDWHKWLDKNYDTDFGLYSEPEFAIEAFLEYVKKNKINVKKLCGS